MPARLRYAAYWSFGEYWILDHALRAVEDDGCQLNVQRRADARTFSLADLSWPQAARMSRPLGVRIGLA